MPAWNDYSVKDTTPADTDTLMIKDNAATGTPNKRLLFSKLFDYIMSKTYAFTQGTKSIPAAINELNSGKADTSDVGDLTELETTDKSSIVGAVNELVSGKVDVAQGSGNAGKALVINASGNVEPGDVLIDIDDTLTQTGEAADAKTVGDITSSIMSRSDIRREVDSGTWEKGAVSSSGIDPTNNKAAHSGLIDIGDYDYIDFDLTRTDKACWFVVYRYDGENYAVCITGQWVKIGGIRIYRYDGDYQYIIRMRTFSNGTISDPGAWKSSIKVTLGKHNNLCGVEDAGEDGVSREFSIPKALMEVSSSGYAESNANATSAFIPMGDYDSIAFDASQIGAYRYAVYAYDGTGYRVMSGGWTTASMEVTDKTLKYILRVGMEGVSSLTVAQFTEACDAVKVLRCVKSQGVSDKAYGYERTYTDITRTLTFERKAISASGISDSTTSLLAKLPNDGNVECRLNTPGGKFSVWKVSGSTYTNLTTDWTYYQYRYTGDYESDYYVAVATPTDATITLSGYKNVAVLQYLDVGVMRDYGSNLSGKNIAVFGDSIVQGRMSKNGSSVNHTMPKPYANLLAEIAGTEPNDFGIGGALVYDNDWKSLSRHYDVVTGYDLVILCAGTNDFGGHVPLADFRTAYSTVLSAVVNANTEVVVCTPTRRSTNSKDSTTQLYLQDYATAEIEIAEEMDVKVIDLYTLTNTANFRGQLSDGIHPNEIGAKMIADLIVENY